MAIKKGICKNYGECDIADTKPPVVQEADSTNFVCEECGKPLTECGKTPPPPPPIKTILAAIAGLAVVGGGGAYYFLSSSDTTPQPEQVTLTKSASELVVGQADTLQAIVTPIEATAQFEWTSSDANIVSVDNGIVKALAEGKAQISVQVAGAEGLTDVCTYTVTTKAKDPDGGKEGEGGGENPSTSINLGYASYQGDTKNGKPHGNGTLMFKSRHLIPGTKDNYAEAGEQVIGAFRDGEINMGTLYQKNGNRVVVKHK
ncbi:Ig domain-containing protein [Bacteroides sp. AN502]|nr:Ig domain-containing protein [Caecibacteroides pullorum]MDC6281358.1 Ig-like domain-containing protein [Caecibacteroides pullorum]